jgi:transcriptional regulator with XRE-family HTH domain
MPMIDAAQIRAARSLLRWTLDRLHKASGVSINGINQIEREKVSAPRQETLDSLQKAFEAAGVEFLPNSGVRKKDRIVETYEGRGSNRRLIEDIYWTLHNSGGGEILIAHLDEDRAIKELGKSFIEEQIRLRKAAKITHRLLVRANDPGLIPPADTYHSMPDKYFSSHPLYIYGSKLAILAWDPTKSGVAKSVVIDDARFADSARQLFNFIWDHTEMINPRQGTQ